MKNGSPRRNKGKRGEREACEVLRPIFPNVRRRAMQARGGGEGADLENTGPFHVEVGCGRVNPRAKMEQACEDREFSYTPLALTRGDHKPWLVTMRASDWIDMYQRMVGTTGELVAEIQRLRSALAAWELKRDGATITKLAERSTVFSRAGLQPNHRGPPDADAQDAPGSTQGVGVVSRDGSGASVEPGGSEPPS